MKEMAQRIYEREVFRDAGLANEWIQLKRKMKTPPSLEVFSHGVRNSNSTPMQYAQDYDPKDPDWNRKGD